MKNENSVEGNTTRRAFMQTAGGAVVASAALAGGLSMPAYAAKKARTLKVGLIGCGGRGTGAARQALTGMAPADRFGRHQPTLARTGRSFDNLSASELASIHDLRLRVVQASAGESLAALSRRTHNAMSLEKTAIANGLDPNAALAAGESVKIAIEVRYAR